MRYPLWFRIAIAVTLAIILLGVVVADIKSDGYEAQTLSITLVTSLAIILGGPRDKGGDG